MSDVPIVCSSTPLWVMPSTSSHGAVIAAGIGVHLVTIILASFCETHDPRIAVVDRCLNNHPGYRRCRHRTPPSESTPSPQEGKLQLLRQASVSMLLPSSQDSSDVPSPQRAIVRSLRHPSVLSSLPSSHAVLANNAISTSCGGNHYDSRRFLFGCHRHRPRRP